MRVCVSLCLVCILGVVAAGCVVSNAGEAGHFPTAVPGSGTPPAAVGLGTTVAPSPSDVVVDAPGELTLVLDFDKGVYHVGEPILASLTLQNIGSTVVLVNGRMVPNAPWAPSGLRDISLRIEDSAGVGRSFAVMLDVRPVIPDDFVELAPSEMTRVEYGIQNLYAIQQPDTYTVQALYESHLRPSDAIGADPDDTRVAWTGVITSNIASFVLEP